MSFRASRRRVEKSIFNLFIVDFSAPRCFASPSTALKATAFFGRNDICSFQQDIILRKFLLEAKYSINSFLGVCSLRTMFSILYKEKKKYTFVRLDNVIQIGYDTRFGFDGYTIVD